MHSEGVSRSREDADPGSRLGVVLKELAAPAIEAGAASPAEFSPATRYRANTRSGTVSSASVSNLISLPPSL